MRATRWAILAAVMAGWAGCSGGGPAPRSPAPTSEPILVRWSTASEFESYGFHVYRGLAEDGPFQRLTAEVIPGGGTTDVPREYRFEDPTAEPGALYFYYVESVSLRGERRRFTPVRAIRRAGVDTRR